MPLNTKIPQQIVSSTTQALSVKRGEPAMLVADMNRGTIVLMDGKTYGGIPAAREDTQIRAGSSAITVNDGEWSALTGTINIGINPEGFIEDVVSPTDKVLAVGDDGKIATQLSVAYDENTGLFSLKGKAGETISSFTLVIPTGITPKSVALVENPDGQEPGLYLEFVFIDDDDVEIKLYADMDVLKDVYTAGRGITISEDRVISVDEDAISGVIADALIEENSGLKVVNDKLHLDDHASETPEYGLGDETKYGHVKLMDAGDNRATVVAGIAATPAAVKDVDDRAVHKEGDETVSGVKTFVDTPKVTLSDGSVTEVATVDGTVWNKRVDELPEDTESLTENMPIGALVVTDDDGSGGASPIPALQAEIALLKADIKKRGIYNTEEWITESGTWTVPVTGWYEVLLIGGGTGGSVFSNGNNSGVANGGGSGTFEPHLVFLQAGDDISCTIGAGGVGVSTPYANSGGETTFGDLTTDKNNPKAFRHSGSRDTVTDLQKDGAGSIGGGGAAFYPQGNDMDGVQYGAGGSGYVDSTANTLGDKVGDGQQGAIRLRYYDPNKENN